MATRTTRTTTRTTNDKERTYMTTTTSLNIRLTTTQVRSNRFTVFTPAQRKALTDAGTTKRLAAIYGVKTADLFTSTGKVRYVGVEASRRFLNDLRDMTPRKRKANADAIELARVAYGWSPKRIAQAFKVGAGPERKGWAAVHAAHKRS